MRTDDYSKNILVVGGAGYIGSHMVLALHEAGFNPIVLDNLSKGHRDALNEVTLIEGDIADRDLLHRVFESNSISAVMHFASWIEVAESMQFPLKYYQNNVSATLTLLDVMLSHHVKQFIFSSSAAVYGEPTYTPINESHPIHPINPYGRTKRIVEDVLLDLARSDQLQYAALRYFNACGADPLSRTGERHLPESHLIPLVLQAANGEREHINVYGRDYSTKDGTCVRDYVHVSDLADAHLLALQFLRAGHDKLVCNLGTGNGFSVQEVIDAAVNVTGRTIKIIDCERRAGDPAVLVADASFATQTLKWKPKYSDLLTIISHAWNFHCKNSLNH